MKIGNAMKTRFKKITTGINHGRATVFVSLALVSASAEGRESSGDFLEPIASDDFGVLYKNKDGIVKKWSLTGRFDLQFGYQDTDQGNFDEFGVRRFRIGTNVMFKNGWRLKVVANMRQPGEVGYSNLDSAYLSYRRSKHLKFKLGRQTPHFMNEWSTPSEKLAVIERALLVQQVRPRKSTGVKMEGDWNNFDYELGVFSAEWDPEFSGGGAGFFYIANLGYDFTEKYDEWDDFHWQFYYMYNDGDPQNTSVPPYGSSYSTAITLRKNKMGCTAEAIYADGIQGRPDAWGFLVTPTWEVIEDKLDLVMRYHYAKSNGRDGLRLRKRFERLAPSLTDRGRGDEYQSIYLGFRYHLIEDRLTFSSGCEWSEMRDHYGDGGEYNGYSFLSAMRFYF